MPRLIALTLPMILLWFVFHVGGEEESSKGLDVSRGFYGADSERFSDGGLQVEVARRERGFSEISFEKLRSEALTKSERVWASGTKIKGSLAEQVLAEIDPNLLARLPDSDRELLQSYVSKLTSPEASDQPWLCWGEDVSKEKAAAFHEAEKLTGLAGGEYALFANQFLSSGSWNRTAANGFIGNAQGLPITVTWSVVPDGTSAPGLNGQSNEASDFRSWMASIYGGSVSGPAEFEPWFEVFEEAFEEMAETCGITLRYEASDDGVLLSSANTGIVGTRGDIRISARGLDGDSGTLAFAFSPDHGDMVFDSTDGTFENTSASSLRLFNIAAHELGHSLGLAHVCPLNQTKLLEPILTTSFRGPRFDEVQSLQRLYGDPFELNGEVRNNDSTTTATVLNLVEDVNLRYTRLSIDDNNDRDYFRLEALAGQKLTVTARPGEGSYLEGGATTAGCTQGVDFDSNSIHDLTIEIFAEDGETVLALSDDGEAGDLKLINQFEFEEDGIYFVKIDGDTTNATQIYRADFRLGDRDPAPRLSELESVVLAESGLVKNERLDPNETVEVAISVLNSGTLPTGILTVTVTGSENVSIFSSEFPETIDSSETTALNVVFGALGECGDFATLSFEISDESGLLLAFDRDFRMGDIITPIAIDEDFDGSSDIPDTWTSVETGAAQPWDAVSSRFVSALRSAFAAGVGSVSDVSLISPSFELAAGGGILSFDHQYRTEVSYDGAILEVSRDEGAWFDLIESPLVTATGGYDTTIRTGFGSAIAGRRAWSADLDVFITTTVELPLEWAGDSLRFRWRMVHDSSSSREGWWIDNVRVEMSVEDCEPHRPVLNLALLSGGLDENDPSQSAILTLSSDLPLAESVTVGLETGGSASGNDFSGSLEVVLAIGQQSVSVPLSVLSDDLTEGVETLSLTIPDDQLQFAPGENGSQLLTIPDLFTINTWLAGFFSESVPLTGDSDGDGLSELAEYLLGTDPTSPTSNRNFNLRRAGDDFLIPLSDLPVRSDATLGVESSGNLVNWLPAVFQATEEGLLIESEIEKNFFRLTFSVDQ